MVYPGSYCSPAAAAFLMTQKFVMGSPLYRMEHDFSRSGLDLSRQTMSNWMIYCTETWLMPLYEALHKLLLQAEIINADETELQVLREPGRKAQTKSYMWLYRTGSYAEHPVVLYEYQPGRGSKYPLNFLSGFTGYLQTDGYVGYDALKEVTHVGCMAHLKRKFHDAVTALPNGKKAGSAVEGEAYCTKLFHLEDTFAELSPEERKQKRQELAKPILDAFLAWGSTRNASAKSKLGEALTYLHNNGKELSEYLNDGRLEISNNLAERSIKPFVIDRKNFLFANTPKGATASAVMFSIIQTAIANHLDPYAYLAHIFTEAPKMAAKGEDWVTAMLPQNVPDSCKAGRKERSQNKAVLICTGRDIEHRGLELCFSKDSCTWELVSDSVEEPVFLLPEDMKLLIAFMKGRINFSGTNAEFCSEFNNHYGRHIETNHLKRLMNKHRYELEAQGVFFESRRCNGKRLLSIEYRPPDDDSADKDDKTAGAQIIVNTVPIVPDEVSPQSA